MNNIEYFTKCIKEYLSTKEKDNYKISTFIIYSLIESYGEEYLLNCIDNDIFVNKYPKKELLDYMIDNMDYDRKTLDNYLIRMQYLQKLLYLYYYSDYQDKENEITYLNNIYKLLDNKIFRYKNLKKNINLMAFRENCSVMLDKAAEKKSRKK